MGTKQAFQVVVYIMGHWTSTSGDTYGGLLELTIAMLNLFWERGEWSERGSQEGKW
jgi:hypothetical protein